MVYKICYCPLGVLCITSTGYITSLRLWHQGHAFLDRDVVRDALVVGFHLSVRQQHRVRLRRRMQRRMLLEKASLLETGGDGRKVVLELCEGMLSERDS